VQQFTGAIIQSWYDDVQASLTGAEQRILSGADTPSRWVGATPEEVRRHFDKCRDVTEHVAALMLVAAAEAVLREDFEQRIRDRPKDGGVRRAFQQIKRERGTKIRLDEDILEAWTTHRATARTAIAGFRSALKFRHWMAHGQWWTPKLGRHRYRADDILTIVGNLFHALDDVDGWPGAEF
jgi:hypothetical protein